jgi:hypothetical protein
MLNTYFNFQTAHNEQDLVEDLVIESIQIYGMDITYIPKELVNFDALLGEDPLRAFNKSYVIEAYFENNTGFLGDKLFLNKFGENIDKQVIFNVAKRRFDEVKLGLNWQKEWLNTTPYNINDAVHFNGLIYVSKVTLNTGNQPDISPTQWGTVLQVRPYEGDLIYLPVTGDIFEILMVDHEEVFYQLGKIYVWKITCEKYRYSHEVIETGIPVIDQIASDIETDDSGENDPLADNESIEEKVEDFLNLDPNSPF